MTWRSVVATALVACSVVVASAEDAPAPGPDATREALRLTREGRFAEATRLLRDRLAAAADDLDARLLLARILDWDGAADEAAEVLEARAADPGDARALIEAAGIRRRQSRDGPTVTYRRGGVRYAPTRDPAAEEAWKRERARLAVVDLERALALSPPDDVATDAAVKLASLHVDAGALETAVEVLEAQRARSASVEVVSFLAECLMKLGRRDEARPHLEATLALDPTDALAHEALASVLEDAGEQDLAAEHRRRARFHGWVPGFLDVPYDAATAATVAVLASDSVMAVDLGVELSRDRRSQVVLELRSSDSPPAANLLAATYWQAVAPRDPDAGLATTARTADLLEHLGAMKSAVEPLCALIQHARDPEHVRALVRTLARHRGDERALGFLVELLPRDLSPLCPANVAGALAALGDARAVPALVELLAPDQPETPTDPDGHPLEGWGKDLARLRAALALGRLPLDAHAREALEAGLESPLLGAACAAALFRVEGGPARRAALVAALDAADDRSGVVVSDLADLDDPEVRAAVEAYQRRIEASR